MREQAAQRLLKPASFGTFLAGQEKYMHTPSASAKSYVQIRTNIPSIDFPIKKRYTYPIERGETHEK